MIDKAIHEHGVTELADAYQQHWLSPEEVCEHLLARIEDTRINCNAFAYVDRETAFAAARASSQRWRDGEPLGPLDGVPVAIKDVLDVAGMPTRYSTGQPAISIPCGFSDSGLPIGLQLVCDRGCDDLLLAIAEYLSAQLD